MPTAATAARPATQATDDAQADDAARQRMAHEGRVHVVLGPDDLPAASETRVDLAVEQVVEGVQGERSRRAAAGRPMTITRHDGSPPRASTTPSAGWAMVSRACLPRDKSKSAAGSDGAGAPRADGAGASPDHHDAPTSAHLPAPRHGA